MWLCCISVGNIVVLFIDELVCVVGILCGVCICLCWLVVFRGYI